MHVASHCTASAADSNDDTAKDVSQITATRPDPAITNNAARLVTWLEKYMPT